MSTDPNAFLMGSGAPSARFEEPGASVTGRITEEPQVRQQTDFTTGKPLFWDNGDPRMQLVVTLGTDQRDTSIPDDDGTRRVYVKGQMQKAVAQAVRQAGAPGLQVGGTLTVTYTGDGEAKQRGMNPPKLYTAAYTAAAQTFLAADPAPAPAPAPAAAAAPLPSGVDPHQVAAALAALGIVTPPAA